MDVSRVKTNGTREGFQQRAFPPQPQMQSWPQLEPDNYRANSRMYPRDVDLQTLESWFGSLSVFDSSFNPVASNRSSAAVNNQGINGGGGYLLHPNNNYANADSQQIGRLNDSVNGSQTSSTSVMSNNDFLNGNPRDVPYFSRNHLGYGSGINNIWGNHDTVSLAKDRISSLVLLKTISEGSRETIDTIFNDLISHTCDLMVDPFAHHVFQKLMEKCTSQQITQILGILTQHPYRFVRICLDPLGTHAIQSLLRCLQSEDQISGIVEAISIAALTLANSNNAKHVILLCFTQFSPLQNRRLVEVIAGNCYRIATDQYGCCTLQQCLGLGCEELRRRLIMEIISIALKLCVDCYGNYVVQYVAEQGDRHVREALVRNLLGSYGYLSRNKYGSHAVQKFLKTENFDSRLIVFDLLREIDTLLLDPFGNYVIQTLWFVSQDDIRHRLMWHIRSNIQLMSCNKFGRKLLEKLKLNNRW